jgi:hypothetical protein
MSKATDNRIARYRDMIEYHKGMRDECYQFSNTEGAQYHAGAISVYVAEITAAESQNKIDAMVIRCG